MEANASGDAAQAAAKPQNGKIKRHLRTVDEKWWFNHWTQQEPDLALSTSASFLAEISVSSPRKISIFII